MKDVYYGPEGLDSVASQINAQFGPGANTLYLACLLLQETVACLLQMLNSKITCLPLQRSKVFQNKS